MLHTATETTSDAGTPVFVSIQTSAFSGATLLARLLGAHPQIATVGEMDGLIPREDPDLYECSCGQKIRHCDFWNAVARGMQQRGFNFDVGQFGTAFVLDGPRPIQYLRKTLFQSPALKRLRNALFQAWPRERHQMQALVARNEAFVEAVLAVTGKRVFVDTSKDRLRLHALRAFSKFDVRAVHLVRDARGVVASRLRRSSSIDVEAAARQWAQTHQRLQRAVQTLPRGKYMRVRYEDLCQDLSGTLECLYRFCEVDPDVNVADYWTVSHHIVGNPMRLVNLSEIRCDERWRQVLTAAQQHHIDQAVGFLNRQYGYH